jgi:hypothetical protein
VLIVGAAGSACYQSALISAYEASASCGIGGYGCPPTTYPLHLLCGSRPRLHRFLRTACTYRVQPVCNSWQKAAASSRNSPSSAVQWVEPTAAAACPFYGCDPELWCPGISMSTEAGRFWPPKWSISCTFNADKAPLHHAWSACSPRQQTPYPPTLSVAVSASSRQ